MHRIMLKGDPVSIRGRITNTARVCDPWPCCEFTVDSKAVATAFWPPEAQLIETDAGTLCRATVLEDHPGDLVMCAVDGVRHKVVIPRAAIVTDPDVEAERIAAMEQQREMDERALLMKLKEKYGL